MRARPSEFRPRKLWIALAVAGALALHWWMAESVSPRMGVTADEVVHLTGGYTYWKFDDYRMHPENGTLAMRLAALPWLAMDLQTPRLDSPDWRHSKVNEWGDELMFRLGNPIDAMMHRARMMIALAGAFTVWLTWRWARGLFGGRAGWVALGLATFCPALLAASGLATSDMTMTACVLGALSLMWLVLHRATWPRVLGAALGCGLAFLSKMSGVLIVPLIGLMLVVRWLRPVPFVWKLGGGARWLRRRGQIIGATTGLTVAIAAGSLVVLWAGYGFRYEAFNRARSDAADFFFSWDTILDKAPLPQIGVSSLDALVPGRLPQKESGMSHLIAWLRDRRLLPEAYLWGFAHTYKFARYRPAFFLGEYRTTGWRSFFPVAFVLKTPLPALVLIVAGVAALWFFRGGRRRSAWRPKPWVYRATPLLLFFVVYWTMAIRMALNIGHRHIMPTYPVFYVLASAAALWLALPARKWIALGLATAVALQAADSLAARPFYLSYFQPLFGGVDRGYRYLVDSSYDWGQGLPDLARWLEHKKAAGDRTPVFLTYFGADNPRARGLDVIRFADAMFDYGPRSYPAQLRGGWFVISATHFRRVYMPTRGPWTPADEQLFQAIRARLLSAQATGLSPNLTDAADYEMLCFGRLTHYLEHRDPLEVIGGSLLVFRLTDADVALALNAPLDTLERAAAAAAR